MSRTAISANKVVVGLPRHRPRGAAPSLDPANVGTASEPTVKIGPCLPGGNSHQRHVDPTLAAMSRTGKPTRHSCLWNDAGRPTPHTNWSPAQPRDTEGEPPLRDASPDGAPDSSSHLHEAQPGRVWGGHSTVKEPPSAPRRMGAANARSPPRPEAQAPRFQPPITTAPACPWGVTEAERKEAPASSPATAARIGHSGSGVV